MFIEEVIKKITSNIRKKSMFRSALTAALLATCGTSWAQTYATHSVLSSGTWFKVAISNPGVCRISISDLPALSGVPCNQIALFGNGGGVMPMKNDASRINDLNQVAISIRDANSNGIIDASDYIIFYAEAADLWRFNTENGLLQHEHHPYSSYNYYYLTTTWDGTPKRIPTSSQLEPNVGTISNYTSVALWENDLLNTHETGQIWVGEKFTSTTNQRSFNLSVPNITPGTSLRVRAALASISTAESRFTFSYSGTTSNLPFTENQPYSILTQTYTAGTPPFNFTITYNPSVNLANGYLDFIELNATSPMTFSNGQVDYYNLLHIASGNIAQFNISTTNSNIRIWDVSRNDSVVEMTSTRNASIVSFVAPTESIGHFVAFDGSSFVSPSSIVSMPNQDIHGESGADLVIITHPAFLSQSQELANLHLIYDGIGSLILTPDMVYNEFSSGKQDPMAIREMLRMFYKRATNQGSGVAPRYLLLFGRATYDNKDILGNNHTQILTCQSEASFTNEGGSYATDDLFGYLDDGERGIQNESLEVGIGRLPAKSVDEANHMLDKIRRYMQKNDLNQSDIRGDWRNYITLLADDADPSSPGDTIFASSSENLARRINSLYPHYNIDKIFADAYTQQSSAIGSYYPDVNNALRQRLNYGCLLFNYVGHGSVEYIGTERYIEPNDISAYANHDQLALFVTSTCSYGRYDKLSATSGAELLMLADGAAIGVITASRPIGHIERFNIDLCVNSITPGNSIGDAIRLSKNATSVSHSFLLLGDPALRLSMPDNNVHITEINGHPITEGIDDTASVLSRVTVKGEILDPDGIRINTFNGSIYPIVFDRTTTTHTLANDNEGTEVNFTQQNNILYRGHEKVEDGLFEYSFIIPRDVSTRYDYAKLSHFAKSDDGMCATGSYGNLLIGGFDQDADLTECRPSIRLYMNDTNFRNGGITDENPSIFAILEDNVGINAVGSGIGHNITAIVDGNPSTELVLNDFYQTDLTNSRRGVVLYGLSNLTSGRHTVTLKAWNIYNYSNEATVEFYVHGADSMIIGRCYAYPNPVADHTTIHVEHNNISNIASISIDILSSAGQVVRHLHPQTPQNSFVITEQWDMLNDSGATVSDGVYVARIVVRTADGKKDHTYCKIVKLK